MPRLSTSSDYSGADIEILELHEMVRRRPEMFVGPTDQRGLHGLLRRAVESLLWRYSFLGLPLTRLTVCLENDGSATLTTEGSVPAAPFWGLSAERLARELQRGDLFAAGALSDVLHMTLRGPDHQWRSLLFERGVLRGDELHSCGPDGTSDIWLRLWPDFSIFEPGAFDYQDTLELIRPLSEKYPATAITVTDNRPHSA